MGRNKAVAEFGKVHIAGFLAWFTWVFVHLMYLVEFENRILVLTEWVHNYITRNRGARLITARQAVTGDRLPDFDVAHEDGALAGVGGIGRKRAVDFEFERGLQRRAGFAARNRNRRLRKITWVAMGRPATLAVRVSGKARFSGTVTLSATR